MTVLEAMSILGPVLTAATAGVVTAASLRHNRESARRHELEAALDRLIEAGTEAHHAIQELRATVAAYVPEWELARPPDEPEYVAARARARAAQVTVDAATTSVELRLPDEEHPLWVPLAPIRMRVAGAINGTPSRRAMETATDEERAALETRSSSAVQAWDRVRWELAVAAREHFASRGGGAVGAGGGWRWKRRLGLRGRGNEGAAVALDAGRDQPSERPEA